ncbi:MAG: anthrone oxygenase family protein, partial [Pseudomonadota bacterium]
GNIAEHGHQEHGWDINKRRGAAPLVYVPTVFLMTVFGNVPMNNRLERLDYRSTEAATYWQIYGRDWTRLNHVRTFGSILTAGCYLVAAITLVA